jgi:hypothetical protein
MIFIVNNIHLIGTFHNGNIKYSFHNINFSQKSLSTVTINQNFKFDNNIARIKTPDDHWYISTFYSQDYVIIDAVKCRDIPMVFRRLYSGIVIVNDYVVPAVKCRDIPMVVRR